MKSLFDLTGKVAVVTGAASGLGRSAALAYAEHGASVGVLDINDGPLDGLVKEIESKGVKAVAAGCDLTREGDVKAAVDKFMGAFGKIDILLNNAGVAIMGSVEDLPLEDWNRGLAINLSSMFLTCKYIVPHMKAAKYGKIINISSVDSFIANKGDEMIRHSYNATKAGVRGLTMGMAACYSKYGLNINSISPALFRTEMTEKALFQYKPFMDRYLSQNAIGRPGEQVEFNGLVLFLSSDASSYVTAQNIIIDGGLHNIY